jgi:hypothetical protein
MLGWFSPRCPVSTWEKAWTETRMRWLVDQFGLERLQRAEVILPEERYFPDPYRGLAADAQRMMERLCGYMGVPPHTVELKVTSDTQLPRAVGSYQRDRPGGPALVRVAASQLANPQALVATLAHELAHEVLLGGGFLADTVPDHEQITDLLLVYLGVGVFAANTTLHEEYHSEGPLSWWIIGRQGYLPARVYGYGFALFAFLRGAAHSPWSAYLRRDAASVFRSGLDYLHKTGDALCRPDTIGVKRDPLAPSEAVERLRTGTPGARLAA